MDVSLFILYVGKNVRRRTIQAARGETEQFGFVSAGATLWRTATDGSGRHILGNGLSSLLTPLPNTQQPPTSYGNETSQEEYEKATSLALRGASHILDGLVANVERDTHYVAGSRCGAA